MSIFSEITDIIFPPRCVFCSKFLKKSERSICSVCSQRLPKTSQAAYKASGHYFEICVSPFYYTGIVRDSLHRFKFANARENVKYYGEILADCIRDELSGRYDIISWVPVSREHLRSRGYDQSMLLAQCTASSLGETAVEALLKIRNTEVQSRITDRNERTRNVRGAYSAAAPELIRDKRILLIDDIITTGATLSECAKTLRMAGAKSVVCAALARSSGL